MSEGRLLLHPQPEDAPCPCDDDKGRA